MVTVRDVTSADAARWDQFVLAHPLASSYHLYGWRTPLGRTLLHSTHYLGAWRNGGLVGVLPMVHLRRPLMGDLLVSLPFVNYGGILAEDSGVALSLREAAIARAKRLGVQELELRHSHPNSVADLPARASRVSMQLELPSTADALSKLIGSKLRNQVRKSEKSGLTSYAAGEEGLDAFYQVFVRNMRDLGSPVWPLFFFRSILRAFPDRARLHIVSHAGTPVAAGFLFRFKKTLEIPWASALREYNPSCANVRLYHDILQGAVKDGFQFFDFGRSAPDSGTYKFKKQWGAREVPLYWHYWPESTQSSGRAIETHRDTLATYWQRLPVWSTRVLGPPIRRLFAQ